MDKLKNLMSGNKDKDSTIDNTNTTTGDLGNKNTVAGQGSHFGSGRTDDPLSSSTHPTTSGTGSNLGGATGTHGLVEPHSSRMPGGFDDDADTTASVSSGIPGRGQSGKPVGSGALDSGLYTNKPLPPQPGSSGAGLTGSGVTGSGVTGSGYGSNTTAGPHSSNLENKLDPRVDSDLDGRSGLGNTRSGTGSGLTGNTSGGLGSHNTGAGTTGAGTGLGSNTDSGRSFPLSGTSNTGTTSGSNTGFSAPGQVGTYAAGGAGPGRSGQSTGVTGTGSGLSGNTTAGPHSSNLENKIDPRVDSDLDGRSGLGNTTSGTTGTGRTGYNTGVAGTGSGLSGNTTAGPHSSNLENKLDPRVDSDRDGRSGLGNTTSGTTGTGYGSGTGPTATSGHSGHLGRDAALGAGAGATAGAVGASHGPNSWEHQHGGHAHTYEGDPCGPESAVPGVHHTTGPHATDTANRLDPHVNSGIGATGSTTGGTTRTGLGSGTGLGSSTDGTASDPYGSSTSGTGHHHGRDAALGAGAGAVGVGAYEAGREHPQSSSTGPAPKTAGPHKSDMLNKLDPRVDSDLSKQQSGTTGAGVGSTGTGSGLGSSTTGTSHHTGRDAALAGGAGAAGVGAYEAEKHHHSSHDPTATSTSGLGSSTTAGAPHHSHHQGHHDRQQHAGDHHLGRDAGLAGAGAAGVGAYEAEKHHHGSHDPTNTTGTSGLGSSTLTGAPHHSHHQGHHDRQQHAGDHHLGRDAGLAGAGTGAAYEAERHHGHPTQSSTIPSTTGGLTSGTRDPAISGSGNQTGTGHHYGRDAGLVGAGGIGAYEADKHLGHHDSAGERLAGSGHHPNTATTGTGTSGLTNDPSGTGLQSGNVGGAGQRDHHLGRDAALGAGAGGVAYEAEKHHHNQQHPTSSTGITGSQDPQHHYGRDAALGAGVAGAGYEADKHHHDKEAKKLEHEREKEASHHDSGKKSGGILGLFSRDKGDKEAKKEERAEEKAERKAEHGHHTGRDAALGAGAAGTAYEADKHHHTRGQDNEEMAAGPGAVGLESDMKNTSLGGRDTQPLGQGQTMAGSGNQMQSSQAGVQDSAISSGSNVAGIGGGMTTHDAYGEQDPNRINRLHKDPPAGRGL